MFNFFFNALLTRLTLNRGFKIIWHAIWPSPDNKIETVTNPLMLKAKACTQ